MRDITKKRSSLRTARARASMIMNAESIQAIQENKGPKPDVIPTAKAAGYLAVKNTSQVIPHCHPIPVEDVTIEVEMSGTELHVYCETKTEYKTGCEMEALHGASIAALTIYDMLKPIDKEIIISGIVLEEKKGGKSDFSEPIPKDLKAAVLVISDSVAAGKKEDSAGLAIKEKLSDLGISVEEYVIVPDEPDDIRKQVDSLCSQGIGLLISTGGTGLSPRDNTPEAILPMLDQEIPGIMEAARAYGQAKTPYAMLSRGIAGLIGRTLVLALPGSTRGAMESMDALFPAILHIFAVQEHAYRHEHTHKH